MLHGATDQRMTNKQLHRFFNQSNRFRGDRKISLDQEVGESFEIGKRLSRITQLCQDRAFGLADFLPEIRALR